MDSWAMALRSEQGAIFSDVEIGESQVKPDITNVLQKDNEQLEMAKLRDISENHRTSSFENYKVKCIEASVSK